MDFQRVRKLLKTGEANFAEAHKSAEMHENKAVESLGAGGRASVRVSARQTLARKAYPVTVRDDFGGVQGPAEARPDWPRAEGISFGVVFLGS
jgi:hypothetical protein